MERATEISTRPVSRSLLPPRAVASLRRSLTADGVSLEKSSYIVFVCGRSSAGGMGTSARDTLLQYARRHWADYHFFRAEDAFRALPKSQDRVDLLTYERTLARYSDCILMILESAGVIAELGAFAHDEALHKSVLVLSSSEFRGQESFIAKGPLAKISRNSRFGDVIYTDLETCLSEAAVIEDRLREDSPKIARRVRFRDEEGLVFPQTSKEGLLLLLDLIGLFSPLRYAELIAVLLDLFGEGSYDVRDQLSLLEALGLITRRESFYLRTTERRGLFLRFDKKVGYAGLRSWVIAHYHKYSPQRIDALWEYARASGEAGT